MESLDLWGNPIVYEKNYWYEIIVKLPWLEKLNGEKIQEGDWLLAKELLRQVFYEKEKGGLFWS